MVSQRDIQRLVRSSALSGEDRGMLRLWATPVWTMHECLQIKRYRVFARCWSSGCEVARWLARQLHAEVHARHAEEARLTWQGAGARS